MSLLSLLSLLACQSEPVAPTTLESPEQGLRAALDAQGVRLSAGEAPGLTVRTEAVGRATGMRLVTTGPASVRPCDAGPGGAAPCEARVERTLGGAAVAWWATGPDGVMQGWTFDLEPSGQGPLQIDVAMDGYDAVASADGLSATLTRGAARMSYGGLKAWDADGDVLSARLEDRPGGLRVVVDVEGADWPVTVDPVFSSSPETTFQLVNGGFGHSLAVADLTGDGVDDLAVGAFNASAPGVVATGAVLLYAGSTAGLQPVENATLFGSEFGARFGISFGAADVTGDGQVDLVVGAPRSSEGGTNTFGFALGAVSVYPGLAFANPDVIGPSNGAGGFGDHVAPVGDLDGDGRVDVLVAQPLNNTVSVLRGSPVGLAPWFEATGLTGRQLGTWATSCDIDGDGALDVVVSALGNTGNDGYLSVLEIEDDGAGPSLVEQYQVFPADSVSGEARRRFGVQVACGDFDADGFGDVVLTTLDDFQVLVGSAGGLMSEPVLRRSGAYRAVHVDDMDADGFDDLVVGAAAGTAGLVEVYSGSAAGIASVAAWTSTIITRPNSIASGDFDDDGVDDLAVGDSVADDVYVFLGSTTSSLVPAADDTSGPEGTPIPLDASASEGDLVAWRWDCTDDGSFDTTGETASCTYPDDGVYTVRLQVEDAAGTTDETTATVTVSNADPVVSSFPAVSGSTDVPVTLAAFATDVAADTLTWSIDCGDGSGFQPSADGTLACTYPAEAVYTAVVEVSDEDGGFATASATVTIGTPPIPKVDLTQAIVDANASWGDDVLVASASSTRLRPANVQRAIDALTDRLATSGCVADPSTLSTAAGSYAGASVVGFWDGGVVSGGLDRTTKTFSGDFVGGPAFGDDFGAYNRQAQLIADRGPNAFAAGRWIRVQGTRGVWLTVHGTCAPGVHPSDALEGWARSDLSAW
jgi:hypothetical protein